jgi:hypothetical protein
MKNIDKYIKDHVENPNSKIRNCLIFFSILLLLIAFIQISHEFYLIHHYLTV